MSNKPTFYLTAKCDGCEEEVQMPTHRPRQINAPQPTGWVGFGLSRYVSLGKAGRTALWCTDCWQQKGFPSGNQ